MLKRYPFLMGFQLQLTNFTLVVKELRIVMYIMYKIHTYIRM